ncbi:MAG TPA: ATPase domain-containing protein [Gemmatimonadales bacterium]|nr:ATPase domain-containing protein [Gemmatimonadales bacterium]
MTSADSARDGHAEPRASTGIAGLDSILGGGLPADHLFLIEGAPGTGKTTLALQFLMEGVARGESALYVTLAETRSELDKVAGSHGWSLDGLDVLELTPPDEVLQPELQYTVFHPSDVEMGQTMRAVYDAVERLRPRRLVLDSLSEMRLLAQDPLRLRRQVLAIKHFFIGRRCSVMLLDDMRSADHDLQFASIAHGVILLEQSALEYGAERRRLRVSKLRAQRYRGGYHDFTIRTGGLEVYPRLVGSEYPFVEADEPLLSGNERIDALTGGGLDRGSSNLFVGPAGVGKSTLASQFALTVAERGEQVAIYLFDERLRTFHARAKGLGMEFAPHVESGRVSIQQIDPAEVSPGQFAHLVVRGVEEGGARLVVIDSLSGYMNAMPEDRMLMIHLHELISYLTQRGVTAIMTLAQHGPLAHGSSQGAEVSYLADAIVLLRYFEAAGVVRQAVSMLKKRGGQHEQTIREFRIDRGGLHLGEPLHGFQGVLTGVPQYVGMHEPLMDAGTAAGDVILGS